MQIAASVITHERITTGPNPRTLRRQRVRHPRVWGAGSGRHDHRGMIRHGDAASPEERDNLCATRSFTSTFIANGEHFFCMPSIQSQTVK